MDVPVRSLDEGRVDLGDAEGKPWKDTKLWLSACGLSCCDSSSSCLTWLDDSGLGPQVGQVDVGLSAINDGVGVLASPVSRGPVRHGHLWGNRWTTMATMTRRTACDPEDPLHYLQRTGGFSLTVVLTLFHGFCCFVFLDLKHQTAAHNPPQQPHPRPPIAPRERQRNTSECLLTNP